MLRYSLFAVLALCTSAMADNPVKMGSTVKDFELKDIRFLPQSTKDMANDKVTVLVFTTTSCPLVQRYIPELNRLEKEYRSKGVQFLGINVGTNDSIRDMAAFAVEYRIAFPMLKDFDGVAVKAVGAERTPEVVVLDRKRKLRYRGRINDQFRLGGARPKVTRQELRAALDAILDDKEVAVDETAVDGCLITFDELPKPKEKLTFTEHVAPLLKKHCWECHHPDTAAPFSLLRYRQVRARADMIAEVVREQRMPPWYAKGGSRKWLNHRGLSSRERETIRQWVANGRAKGDEAKMPKVPSYEAVREWRIGKPSLVLKSGVHTLPADGVIPYKYNILTKLFTRDTWVQSIEIKPNNRRVVHHANLAYMTIGKRPGAQNFLTGYVPGGDPMHVDNGQALLIPAGSTLLLQIHYVSTGKPEKCQFEVAFKYASGKIDQRLRFVLLEKHRFRIPAGATSHPVSKSWTLPENATGVGAFAHMHLRGKDMTIRAQYPNGKEEEILMVPNFNFDWQMGYRWKPGAMRLPKGTRLECIGHYDNSAFNPYNPNPKVEVREGLQTTNEMLNGFVFFTYDNEKLNMQIDGKTGRPVKKE